MSSSRLAKRSRDFSRAIAWRVASWTGGYAERMIAKEWKSVRLPAGVAFETAATVWHNYGTAYYALVERARAQPVKRCLSLGPPAGLDSPPSTSPAIWACASSPVSAPTTRQIWCAVTVRCDVINYRSEDLRERIKSITSGEGVDICFDNVGGTDFRANGAADEVGWTADADRLHQRPDSFGADEPSAVEELFHCRCLYRRLDREIP